MVSCACYLISIACIYAIENVQSIKPCYFLFIIYFAFFLAKNALCFEIVLLLWLFEMFYFVDLNLLLCQS